ncbi:MAG: efflux transporter, family, subunit [Ferruginibacter sp.]|uniref:efflux RND transporter periplasmic adaptor subunit n=1 Tax=Ferruginibacter sp. TaxID=1940288 RepID=UPI00265B47F7|nr:efflux RND transporter periplasmic adaptor subunit [Ferruginibacter sp.]MDB5277168.1 efflux transporter, family, subunit [Ferruginibacter sp.]
MYLKYLQLYAGYATLFLLTACGNSKDQAPPPPPPPARVTVQPVIKTDAVYYDEYPATINALNQVELRPQVSGFISGVYFKDGARVRKGQLLYSIDEQLYAANYQQALAGLSVQEANLNKAQKDANRFHELDKNDAVAKQLVDNADAALEVAKKQAEAARANIQAVQTNVKYTKVYAPFDGLIGISAVKPGAAVTAGQTVLNTVSSDRELAVDFNVDQKEIYRFTKLMDDAPKKGDSTFSLAFGTDVYPYPGKIALLDRAVNAQTGTIKARLIFPNNKNLLIAGMNGTVRVKNNSATQSLLIPYKAVTEQLGEFFVYVPNDSNKVSQRKIVPGKQIGANVIVKDGLKDGESVVVEGVQNLREGAAINTSSSQPAAPTTTAK